ncbi:hypothetical protein B296_00003610 [Ensete ventricosum]|uniref:Integrase catalytic domain-containing protein n=1 Tax=Ensete ventricosum TaxID=4639 RepID=A0A427BCC9_ENSVE|nr:hypothetical protein B296_00003610 [Ensete ventricosum]
MDLLSPFPPASGQQKFLIVGVDYFSKWIEAEPLASITKKQVEGFVWRNIITRFDISRAIITDNGTQFNNPKFKAFCESYRIQLRFSSIAHPQTNGLAEVTNRAILDGLKKRVQGARGTWVDELPSILWASRTTPKCTTGESPFSLAFGTEAVLPPEVVYPTLRVEFYEDSASTDQLRENLDFLEEQRAAAHLRTLKYKKAAARLYNRKGKLAANWEGPYRVETSPWEGTFTLVTMEGKRPPRTWHVSNLWKFYV